jgi:2-C-methyl-D-erythritol 4-phosphate cytidylyltransferase
MRDKLRIARAPQSFWLNEILQAHRESLKHDKINFIDSGSMMSYYGKRLYLVDGPTDNIKVTTPDDFYSMRAILEAKENVQLHGYSE